MLHAQPMHARRVMVMNESAQAAVRDLDAFEWNLSYPDDVRPRSFFSRSCDKIGLSLSQNNANALFCLASLRK